MGYAQRGSRFRTAAAVAGLAGIATVIFQSAARLPLVADDYGYLGRVQRPGWWHSGAVWDPSRNPYRPILFVWFGMLDRLFGLHPLPFHIATGLLVVAAGVMTGLVARRLGLRSGAYAAAAFFCLHASMATPIAWTSAASSPLAAALALGALYCMLRPRPRPVDVVAACGLLLLALLTREVVAVTPVILVMTRYLIDAGGRWPARLKRALVTSLPLWLVLVAYAVARRLAGFVSSSGPYEQRLGAHGVRNLRRLMEIATDLEAFVDSRAYGALVVVFWFALIGLCALASLHSHRSTGLVGLGWAFLGVLPVMFLAVHPMAYYYIDFALPGLALAVGTVFEWIADAVSGRAAEHGRIAVAATCLAFLAALSFSSARKEVDAFPSWADRTALIIDQVKRDNPRPAPGSTIVVRTDDSGARFLTSNGALFCVIFHDPSLRVRYVPLQRSGGHAAG